MIKFWEVTNFMSIKHGKCVFDESNIINIKGYNDSGKSAMLRALDVILFNIKPNSQVSFIREGEDYFRIVVGFDDGVTILRDKYINGQSLYEMYKDDKLLFSTKVNGVLSKVTGVPTVIADYLALIPLDGGNLNSRSCFEKQFLTQTTGAENYKMLHTILRAEELARAGELINNDKNSLLNDISQLEQTLSVYTEVYRKGKGLTEELMDSVNGLEESLNSGEGRVNELKRVMGTRDALTEVQVSPKIEPISPEKLEVLSSLVSVVGELNGTQVFPELSAVEYNRLAEVKGLLDAVQGVSALGVTPELPTVEYERLSLLEELNGCIQGVAELGVTPKLSVVDLERGSLLSGYLKLQEDYEVVEALEKSLSIELSEVQEQLKELTSEFEGKYKVCPNCGTYVEV